MASLLMINLIWYLCMLIVFISFSSFEARFLDGPNMFLKNGNSGASEHIIFRQVSKTSMEKQEIIEKHFKSKKQELLRDAADEKRVLKMESAKKMFKESVRRQEALGNFFESKRVSPGGPDPHHHKLL
ncbi:hypothetical protein EZV62_008074 [Acer yangbiense]|uniref:Uncharacterized protein n=1 Tax=Acer yangbiense TaxID=1000413 RepID=A0A5C7ID42_9ROSI|nr:hypothetical protein EZV62_008074 [Acer yangbiense]